MLSRGPEVVICVPSGATSVERRAIRAAAFNAGGREAWLIEEHSLQIGEATAERIKKEIGSAVITPESHLVVGHVSGQDVAKGVPSEIFISQAEIAGALREPIAQIVQIVVAALEKTKPEIAADVIDQGITMTGGGSLLRNIDRLIADETGLPVHVATGPLICVALGAGRVLEDPAYREALCPA
jgi:rod shape-determining protein MreB